MEKYFVHCDVEGSMLLSRVVVLSSRKKCTSYAVTRASIELDWAHSGESPSFPARIAGIGRVNVESGGST